MSLSGIINTDLRSIYTDGEDEMYRGLKLPCTLYFPSIQTPCSSCQGQAIGQFPGNILQHGIPVPLFGMGCPECGGVGYKESQPTESVDMQVNINPAKFIQQFKMIMLEQPGQYAQTKSPITGMPKILKCVAISLNTNLGALVDYQYTRCSEPIAGGLFQDRYCYVLWRRNG